MIDNSNFRLLAVRPLKGCNSLFLKNLEENEFYYFYQGFEEDKENKIIKPIKNFKTQVPPDFHVLINEQNKEENKMNISVSAIIGKNGGGKSSVVELVIRILNNFAVATGFNNKVQVTIYPVKELYAELYYDIGGEIHKIEIQNAECKWNNKSIAELKEELGGGTEEELELKLKAKLGNEFFYTQVSNYSLYAYNSEELKDENEGEENWITGIFHKNDGYQTPIVLNPMRINGDIDVNRERELNKDRLISLFLTNDISERSFRRINDKQIAVLFQVKSQRGKSKLEEKTFLDFFENYSAKWKLDYLKNKDVKAAYSFEDLTIDLAQNCKRSNEKYKPNFRNKKTSDKSLIFAKNMQAIAQILTKDEFQYFWKKSLKVYPNLGSLSSTIATPLTHIENLQKNGEFKQVIDDIKNTILFFTPQLKNKKEGGYINPIHLQRIVTAAFCSKIWKEKLKMGQIINALEQKLLDYIVYKSLSIISKYPNYGTHRKNVFTELDIFNDGIAYESLKNNLKLAINIIYDEDICSQKTHITLKLRQCINFLNTNHPYRKLNFSKKGKFISITKYYNIINEMFLSRGERNETDSIENRSKNIYAAYEYFLPPIFDTEIVLEQLIENQESRYAKESKTVGFKKVDLEKDSNLTNVSQLSSGEQQQLNAISSVIYHLRNIASVANDQQIVKYKYVNLFFEEIELYFHPEYQRTYLDSLLTHLSKTNLNLTINLCFVTHSPFILSDIPKQNILVLEDGKPKSISFDTLGANIHEMLGNNFLLDYTIGEIVRKKIDQFLEEYNEYKENKKTYKWIKFKEQKANFKFLIENLGVGYLKNVLNEYYYEMQNDEKSPETLKEQIERKEKELKKQKEELEKLKKQQRNDKN